VEKEKIQNLNILAALAFIYLQEALILSVVFSCINSSSQDSKRVKFCSLEQTEKFGEADFIHGDIRLSPAVLFKH